MKLAKSNPIRVGTHLIRRNISVEEYPNWLRVEDERISHLATEGDIEEYLSWFVCFPSFFLSRWVHLQIVSCSLVFLVVSRRTKQSRSFYPFSGGFLIFLYELAWRRQFPLCITDTSACYRISWPTDLFDFSSLQSRPSRCLVSHGLFGQLVFSLQIGRLLLGTACQFIPPNLTVNRSSCTLDSNSTLQTSSLLLLVCEGKKGRGWKREWERGERASIFMSEIWIWLSPESILIT